MGSAEVRTFNRVDGGGCTTGSSSAVAARMAGECGAATTLTLLPGHGRTASTAPAPAAAQQPRPIDPDRRIPLAPDVGASPPPSTLATEPPQDADCQQFLEGILNGKYDAQRDEALLEVIANAILLRGDRPEIRLRHKNGRVCAYSRQLSPREALFNVSQASKRKATARRLVRDGCGVAARLQRGRTPPSGGPVRLSVSEQVGLMAALSMSRVGFNRWRLAIGGARSGLPSLPVLHAARREMYSLPGKQVIVTRSGAHLASLTAAIQERVTALCDADLSSSGLCATPWLCPTRRVRRRPLSPTPALLPQPSRTCTSPSAWTKEGIRRRSRLWLQLSTIPTPTARFTPFW